MNIGLSRSLFFYFAICGFVLNIISGNYPYPLCHNDTKVYLRWDKPMSGWYYWTEHKRLWRKILPNNSYTIYYELDNIYGYWTLIELTWEFDIRDLYPYQNNDTGEDRAKREISSQSQDEEESRENTSRPSYEPPFNVVCPGPCQCEVVKLYNIEEQLFPKWDPIPIRFYKYNSSSLHSLKCVSHLTNQSITAHSLAFDNLQYMTSSDEWIPSLYLSDRCHVLSYNMMYETWIAEFDLSYNSRYGKLYSGNAAECIDTLPSPIYQKWHGNLPIQPNETNDKDIFKEYRYVHVECECQCDKVTIKLLDTTYNFKKDDRCDSHIQNIARRAELYHHLNGLPTISWVKENFFVTEQCDLLYYDHRFNHWILEFRSDHVQTPIKYHNQNRVKCIEHLNRNQLWKSNRGELNANITAICTVSTQL